MKRFFAASRWLARQTASGSIPEFYQDGGPQLAQNFLIVPHVGRRLRSVVGEDMEEEEGEMLQS